MVNQLTHRTMDRSSPVLEPGHRELEPCSYVFDSAYVMLHYSPAEWGPRRGADPTILHRARCDTFLAALLRHLGYAAQFVWIAMRNIISFASQHCDLMSKWGATFEVGSSLVVATRTSSKRPANKAAVRQNCASCRKYWGSAGQM